MLFQSKEIADSPGVALDFRDGLPTQASKLAQLCLRKLTRYSP